MTLSRPDGENSKVEHQCLGPDLSQCPSESGSNKRELPAWTAAAISSPQTIGEAGAPDTRGVRVVGWDAGLRAEPLASGAEWLSPGSRPSSGVERSDQKKKRQENPGAFGYSLLWVYGNT